MTKSTRPRFSRMRLRNFRGFRDSRSIELAPLTFLVGPNSSGKSSILDAILFLAQSQSEVLGDQITPKWIGPLVDLGSYRDTVFGHRTRLPICIDVDVLFDPRPSWHRRIQARYTARISYQFRSKGADPIGYLSQFKIADEITGDYVTVDFPQDTRRHTPIATILGKRFVFDSKAERRRQWYTLADWLQERIYEATRPIRRRSRTAASSWSRLGQMVNAYGYGTLLVQTQRVSSGRAAPQRWYPVGAQESSEMDPRFWWRPSVLKSVDPQSIDAALTEEDPFARPPRDRKSHPKLDTILRKLRIATKISQEKLSAYHSTINVRDSELKVKSNLIDVGYGASQVIPVLEGCLSHRQGPLLVEQPEIHLHPSAQGMLADLLCQASLQRQVIIETHSEHMINRARILIARGELDHRKVIVQYVSRDARGCHVHPIRVARDGEFLDQWPNGFFDERYRDTLVLMQHKRS